jgi:hypothetical protein
MKEISTEKHASHTETLPEKRTYQQPTLQVFGKMHLMTQGSGGQAADGGGQMTMM